MRFEYIGKTKAKLAGIEILSKKDGQTDLRPAVSVSLLVVQPNNTLNMLGPRVRQFFYQKTNKATEVQGTLDGVPMVSDLAQLTDEAKLLGSQSCGKWEQSGCTLRLYLGISGHQDITLRDGTVRKVNFACKEGGAVEWTFDVYTEDVDAETIGELGVLKNHDLDIELTAPELISAQKDVEDGAGKTKAKAAAAIKDKGEAAAPASPFADTPNSTVVTIKGRKGKGLGTDEEQAARQAEVLAKDSSQAWPFPDPDKAKAQTPEEAFSGTAH